MQFPNRKLLVQYTSRRGVFGKLKTALMEIGCEMSEEEDNKLKDPASLFSAVKSVFTNIKPADSNYFLVLDGLDYILRGGRNNTPFIADLINAVRELNMIFQRQHINAKIVILIRYCQLLCVNFI